MAEWLTMAGSAVRIQGLPEFLALIRESETTVETELAVGLLEVGQKVAGDVRGRYSPYSAPGAAGVRAKLSGGQIWTGKVLVAQTLAKSRSMLLRRPNFGPLMMSRAFLPALDDNRAAIEAAGVALVAKLQAEWEAENV